jgi:hypothetical protein
LSPALSALSSMIVRCRTVETLKAADEVLTAGWQARCPLNHHRGLHCRKSEAPHNKSALTLFQISLDSTIRIPYHFSLISVPVKMASFGRVLRPQNAPLGKLIEQYLSPGTPTSFARSRPSWQLETVGLRSRQSPSRVSAPKSKKSLGTVGMSEGGLGSPF